MRELPRWKPAPEVLIAAALGLLALTCAFGSEPGTSRAPASPLSPASPAARPLLPSRFGPEDFATLDDARATRVAAVFPRLTAFLESRRVEVEAAQRASARHTLHAARSAAIAGLEAWLAQPPTPEARTQAAAYLTVAPEELLRDAALLLAAAEEAELRTQIAEIRQETAEDHAHLERVLSDPALSPPEKAQLRAQLADLTANEADMATTGNQVPSPVLDLVTRHKAAIDTWSKWAWKPTPR